MELLVLIILTVAIYLLYKLLLNFTPKGNCNNATTNDKDLIREKAICVVNLMQQVIDEANHCITNIPTGSLDWTNDRFKKELSELLQMVSETSTNTNLTVRIDNENVPLRNIMVGAQLFEANLKRKFPTL